MKKLFLLSLPLLAVSCSVRGNGYHHDNAHVFYRRVEPAQRVVVVNNRNSVPYYRYNQPKKVVVVNKNITHKQTSYKNRFNKRHNIKQNSHRLSRTHKNFNG